MEASPTPPRVARSMTPSVAASSPSAAVSSSSLSTSLVVKESVLVRLRRRMGGSQVGQIQALAPHR
ncbi:unnamed protein product [Linum tenue]|uniref:Uncharacterized protein n=1 Tax=Linum tenue TaxID=586396 RepID=A0AAV0NRX9_9ROSI|nr:unnamed protein product [Linum tenue]